MQKKALPLLLPGERGKFVLDEEALNTLVEGNHSDKEAVIISVAGAFRKGKSFLLDYCLRFIQEGGLGDENEALKGFSWRGGCERDTTGLIAWPEIFSARLPGGRQVGVLFLDTQGAFDSQTTMKEAATIFALSTLISSVQIFNISQNIQEDDLHHLQLFAEYGRLASSKTCLKPFQKLIFLVRDWAYPYEAPFGEDGGKRILERRLSISPNQHPELQSLRKQLHSCFRKLSCFLLPYPGTKVASDPSFDGRPSDLDPSFRLHLLELLKFLLSPESLVVKRIGEQAVKIKDLPFYLKSYMKIFHGDELPEPRTILDATAEANHLAAISGARESYYSLMDSVCGATQPYLRLDIIQSQHYTIKEQVLKDFVNKPMMGGSELTNRYKNQLDKSLEELFQHFKAFNENKNIYKALLTPIFLMSSSVFFYVLSGLLSLIGIYFISNLSNFMTFLSLLSMATWTYSRYTGEMASLGQSIDNLVLVLWEHFIKPLSLSAIDEGQIIAQPPNHVLLPLRDKKQK